MSHLHPNRTDDMSKIPFIDFRPSPRAVQPPPQPGRARVTWQARRLERRLERHAKRDYAVGLLTRLGYPFELRDNGWRVRLRHGGEVIDYDSGPDTWSIEGKRGNGYGHHPKLYDLVAYLRTGVLPGGAPK